MRLSIKVISIFLFSVLSALAVMSVIGINLSIRQATDSVKETAAITLTSLGTTLKDDLGTAYSQLDELSKDSDIRRAISPLSHAFQHARLTRRVEARLAQYVKHNPHFRYLYLGIEDGSILVDRPIPFPEGYDPRIRPWYLGAIANPGAPSINSIYRSVPDNKRMASISCPVTDNEGRIRGVLGVDFLFSRYQKIMQGLAFKSGFIVITHNGTSLFAHSRQPEKGFTFLSEPHNADLKKANSAPDGSIVKIDGESYTAYVKEIPKFRLKIISFVSEAALRHTRQNYIFLYGLTALILLIIVGITGARLARNALAVEQNAIKAKHDFFKNMNHELRTPLNAIVGFVDLLSETPMTTQQTLWLDHTRTAASHLTGIVNDVLDISSIRAGKYRLVNQEYLVHDLMGHVVALVEQTIGEKPIHFHVSMASDMPQVLCGDRMRLKQILLNILHNAVKFTEKGIITLRLKAETERERLRLHISVSDTGCGIAPQNLPHIFEEFTQFAPNPSQGTGLGLALTRQLIQRMGGEISCYSAPGKGSQFTFSVLQRYSSDRIPKRKHARSQTPPRNSQNFVAPKAKVLVVEDDPLSRTMLTEILKKHQISAHTVETGEAFRQAMAYPKRFHLVLTDIKLPDVSGVQVVEQLRHHHPEHLPPIIAMSAGEPSKHRGSAPFDDHVSKPLDLDLFREALVQWLPKHLICHTPQAHTLETMNTRRDQLGEELYDDLLRVFVQDHVGRMEELLEMVRKGKERALLVRVHRLKGALLNIGAGDIAAIAEALEMKLEMGEEVSMEEIQTLRTHILPLAGEMSHPVAI